MRISAGMRSFLAVGVVLGVLGTSVAGCSGPYAGTAEKLKRPSKKKMPEEAAPVAVQIKWQDECSAKFQEEPGKAMQQHNKGASKARSMTGEASELLEQATKATEDSQVSGLTTEAIGKLRNALIEDPYNSEATYQLAAAYTRARRKGCAIALLKRLVALKGYPDFERDANRMINAALDDSTFSPFRKEADEALGH